MCTKVTKQSLIASYIDKFAKCRDELVNLSC